MIQVVHKILRKLRRHGVAATLHLVVMRLLKVFVECKILRAVHIERSNAAFLDFPAQSADGFIGREMLPELAPDPTTEMSNEFVEQALARGDACFALRDGNTLAAYGWYSRGPTPVDEDLEVHFSRDYIYMYKGFTDERYRGQRLHAIGMTRALKHYIASGYKGLVSYVDSTNYESLRSCSRMGYAIFGSLYVLKIFGRCLAFSSPGCARLGLHAEQREKAVVHAARKQPGLKLYK